jgi:hypothetical protein
MARGPKAPERSSFPTMGFPSRDATQVRAGRDRPLKMTIAVSDVLAHVIRKPPLAALRRTLEVEASAYPNQRRLHPPAARTNQLPGKLDEHLHLPRVVGTEIAVCLHLTTITKPRARARELCVRRYPRATPKRLQASSGFSPGRSAEFAAARRRQLWRFVRNVR